MAIRRILSVAAAAAALSTSLLAQAPATPSPTAAPALRLDAIKLPSGFRIELYATGVTGARMMALSPDGTLFVGSRRVGVGNVYALPDRNHDMKADEVIVLAKDLYMPAGVAFRNGSLYVADTSKMLRYDNIEGRLKDPPAPVVVYSNFPQLRLHQWHYMGFGPDGLLYVPIGSPCTDYCDPNVSDYQSPEGGPIKADPRFASIMRMKPDGTGQEIFATGIRNTVGFDWHPVTKELWFTENSRDGMGADIPADEINKAPRPGLNFGYPYCHAGDVKDPAAPPTTDCSKFEKPVYNVGPHVAAIGMRFYTGAMFPAEYKNSIIIAEHGSIPVQRPGQPKVGYRLTVAHLDDKANKVVKYEPFAEGWLSSDGNVMGRPADVLVMPDGSLLVSDDQANVIYRITYAK